MTASNKFCCTQPQERIDSPEPPPRPLANIDGIFAAAVLPDDHPHSMRMPDRKPGTDPDIVKSPGIANKIRMQFRKRSVKSLSKEKEYDNDAQRIDSKEVLHEVLDESSDDQSIEQPVQEHRFGSATDVRSTASPVISDAGTPTVRTSLLNSLGYLRPLIEKPSDLTMSDKPYDMSDNPYDVSDVAIRVATRNHLVGTSSENEKPVAPLPKSSSAPLLPCDDIPIPLQPRRSRSEYDLENTLFVPKSRLSHRQIGTNSIQAKRIPGLRSTSELYELPTLHVQEPTDIESGESRHPSKPDVESESVAAGALSPSDNGMHLHKMDISEQLRCISQLSDVAEDEPHFASPYPWNFHRRERSDFGSSGRGRHSRQKSSTGIDSVTLPASWSRVRTPLRDTSSSIYSRPTSAAPNANEMPYMPIPGPRDIESPVDVHALFADWPLKPSNSTEEVHRKLSNVSQKSAASEYRNKPLPPTPDDSRKQSSTASFVTAANNNDNSSIQWVSPTQQSGSIKSASSSSTETIGSKASKFLQRFSPVRKFVTKRRSTFKFLRPGSRKQQGRSVSTPILNTKPSGRAGVDGPSDDPALLTVQYELTNEPPTATRSVSMSYLGNLEREETSSQMLSPGHLQRRPTAAEFERKLSVVGDDRRRPSVLTNHQRVQELQEEDKKESISLRRQLSRAHALKDDASPLMAQALEKHQQEKASFRSASKQRESLKSSRRSTNSVLLSPPSSELQAESIQEEDETLDPSATSNAGPSSQRSVSFIGLQVPHAWTGGSSLRSKSVDTPETTTLKQDQDKGKQLVATRKPRIGTSLDSWSRYPSHTRAERCGPAGKADAVITRDFAVDINPEEFRLADDVEPSSPEPKHDKKFKPKKHKGTLPRSRSTTFSSIRNYYSNLFGASESTAQNRRTSVSTGGRLSHPELEMLPPPSLEPTVHHRHSHWDPFERLKEDAHIIKDYVKGEGDKIEGYVRKEEDKLETFIHKEEDTIGGFVKKEEHQLGDFVKKEEHKLKVYVQEEEDKLRHHRHHSGDHHSHRSSSPFQEINVFEVKRDHNQAHLPRQESMMVGPNDDIEDAMQPKAASNEKPDTGLTLDGAHSSPPKTTTKTPSKADLWSGIYKECIAETPAQSATTEIPPPALKPVKPRSPEQAKPLDPKSAIRRFPSVTVIDDCKGHFRSVSLISVKTSKSAVFERSSTADLLELIQAREKEEREKLFKGFQVTTAVESVDAN